MAIPTLRPYQSEIAEAVRAAFSEGYTCPLVVLSTGGGKTMLFSFIAEAAARKQNPVMVVAHRQELITQISLSLARFQVQHNVIAPAHVVRKIKVKHFKAFGRSFVDATSTTLVGSVQTIVRQFARIDTIFNSVRDGRPVRGLIIMDESHHVVESSMWGKVMQQYPHALGLKVSATPERLDGKGLGRGSGGFADIMIEGPDMRWLIKNGFLSPYRAFTTSNPVDLAGVKTVMGDYEKKELSARMDKPKVIGDAIEHYKAVAAGMRTIVYCASVAASQHTADAFTAAGVPAAHLDGETPDEQRELIISDFAAGKLLVLCNQALFTEGFDLASVAQKDVTIDCVIDLAPTQSVSLYLQKVGRALRPAPGKVAVILDHAGNMLTHGMPDMERVWTLDGRTKRKKKKKAEEGEEEKDVLARTCPKCLAIHAPEPACPVCGFEYPVHERKVLQVEGHLVEVSEADREALHRERMRRQGQAQTVAELMALGFSRGRAEKIIEARRAKEAAIAQLVTDLQAHAKQTGATPFDSFGVRHSDLRNMRPKELAALQQRVTKALQELAAARVDGAGSFAELMEMERKEGKPPGWAIGVWRDRLQS